jgi:hypothetical protein
MENTIEWWRWFILIAIFGSLLGLWWWVNREKLTWKKLTTPPQYKIKVLERQWVSNHLTLFLVEVDGNRYLLARTNGSLSWQPLDSPPSSVQTNCKET